MHSMKRALAPMFTFIKLSSGRRMHALRHMRRITSDLGETEIRAHLDDAIAHERHVQALNRRWRGRRRGSKYTVTLVSLDQQLGHTVSALRDMVQVYIKGARPDDDKRVRAERLMHELFPDGVYAITSLPYVEKLAAVDMLLDLLADPLANDADALHLEHLVDRLHELMASYRELLSQNDKLRFAEVKAARERGHTFMLEAVAMTLGRYYKAEDADHEHKRDILLQPIAAQDLAMRQYLRNRRRGAAAGDDVALDDVAAGDVAADGMAADTTADDTTADDTTADDTTADDTTADDTTVDDTMVGHVADDVVDGTLADAEHVAADDMTADNNTADDMTADNTAADDTADINTANTAAGGPGTADSTGGARTEHLARAATQSSAAHPRAAISIIGTQSGYR